MVRCESSYVYAGISNEQFAFFFLDRCYKDFSSFFYDSSVPCFFVVFFSASLFPSFHQCSRILMYPVFEERGREYGGGRSVLWRFLVKFHASVSRHHFLDSNSQKKCSSDRFFFTLSGLIHFVLFSVEIFKFLLGYGHF